AMVLDDVAVPVPAERIGREVHRDKRDTGLDEPPREKGHLAPAVTAVALANGGGFGIQIERGAGAAAEDHFHGGTAEALKPGLRRRECVQLAPLIVERTEQRAAVAH